jgi:MYXO-CTERM domain-containing protein
MAFLLYNSLMFVFVTPANRLFLLYLAMLALSAWSADAVARQSDVPALGRLFAPRTPVRGIAVCVWVIVALNAAAWLARIIPSLGTAGPPAYLRGTGLPVNVVYVQDLVLWLPLFAVAAAWLWRRRPWGYLLTGTGLVMWVLESISVAVDQWYGHAAAPASTVASGALVPVSAVLAVAAVLPAALLLHGLSSAGPSVTPASRLAADWFRADPGVAAAARRGWPAWILAALAACTGAAAVWGGIALLRGGFGMPDSWLAGTPPFTGWALPGVALLIGVAGPQLVTVALVAAAGRLGPNAGYLAGLLLVAWIAVQLLILQRFFFLQPVVACLGAVEFLLARSWRQRRRPEGRWPAPRGPKEVDGDE